MSTCLYIPEKKSAHYTRVVSEKIKIIYKWCMEPSSENI